ncbi:MAG: hypothetical protein Q9222_003942 [Ikaeria aurantiellina]
MSTTRHSHAWTITNALGSRVVEVPLETTLPTTTFVTSWHPTVEHRAPAEMPGEISKAMILPTQPVTVVKVFDGTATHETTSMLPLTTRPPSTTTVPGSTKTISGTTAVATDGYFHAYPANGCWDDPECWYSKTHTESMPAATNTLVKGYDTENPPSAKKFFKDSGPFLAIGFAISMLLVLLLWLASLCRRRRQEKKEASRERQRARIASIERDTGAESSQPPVELDSLNSQQERHRLRELDRRQELQEQYRQERMSTNGWFTRGEVYRLKHEENAEGANAGR